MNMGEQEGTAVGEGGGVYKGTGRFSMRGPWRIVVSAVLPDGKNLSQNFYYDVR